MQQRNRLVGLLLVAFVATACTMSTPPARFSFGLIGDLAYRAEEEPALQRVFDALNAAPLAFAAHLGDLSSPRRNSCSDALRALRLTQFQASVHPFIYTPGDNDWTDCHDEQGVAGGDPLERLSTLRERFFPDDQSLGQRKIPLTRQSALGNAAFAKYRENARWQIGTITFTTLHIVGSNNNLGRTAAADAEHAERDRANLAWLTAAFAQAKASSSRGLVIIQQGNIFPTLPPYPGNPNQQPNGAVEIRSALERETIAFAKPVLLVHGDSHYFRVDKPLGRMVRREGPTPSIENFTRLETFGTPNSHWVEVGVEPDNPEVFTIQPRIVPSNRVAR